MDANFCRIAIVIKKLKIVILSTRVNSFNWVNWVNIVDMINRINRANCVRKTFRAIRVIIK